jgi:hypothetical protein
MKVVNQAGFGFAPEVDTALCDNYKCTATTITNAQKPVKLASSPSVKKVV